MPTTLKSNTRPPDSATDRHASSANLEITIELVTRIRRGDKAALELLVARYLPRLRRIGHNRLPRNARSMTDTDDLVQDAMVQTVKHLPHFECRTEGALLAYLRRAVLNRLIDESRRSPRHDVWTDLLDQTLAQGPTPLEQILGREAILRYTAALRTLKPRDRQLIVLRLEQRLTYQEIGRRLCFPSANAARVASKRATGRFAVALKHA